MLVIHAPQAFASISNIPILVAQPIPPLGRLPPNHHAVEGERFASRMGTNGDSVLDGSRLNLIQGGTDIEVQRRILRVSNQQAPPFEQPDDAAAERIQKLEQFIGLGSATSRNRSGNGKVSTNCRTGTSGNT